MGIKALRWFEIMEKRLVLISFILSLLVHTVTIGLLSLSRSENALFRKPLRSIEITYRDLKSQRKQQETLFQDLNIVKNTKQHQKQKIKVLTKKNNMFSVFGDRIKDISKLSGKLRLSQKKTPDITTLDIGRKITLPPLHAEKITNPKYLTYNEDMRDTISRNIKQKAYTYVNHADFEAGEVYLTFVLATSGMLRQVKIIEDKTFANDYLRRVALRSIKESNPFPPFPEGFDYPEFTFNLLISFQN